MNADADLKLALAVENLDELDDQSFNDLLTDLRSDPLLVERLRVQLQMDEMVSRSLAPARRNFEELLRDRFAGQRPSERPPSRKISPKRPSRQSRRPRRGSRFITMVMLCAAALAAAILLLVPWETRAQPMGTFVSAMHASIRHLDGRIEPGYAAMFLQRGDEITTDDDVRSLIAVDRNDGAHLEGGGGLRFAFLDEIRVRMKSGTLLVDVPHAGPPAGEGLVIETASGDVHVTGTRFSVTTDAARTEIVMERGSVLLTNRQGEMVVSAGERGHMGLDSAPAKQPVTDPPITAIGEPGRPSLSVSATRAQPLQEVSVTLANGPANTQDWIGLYRIDAPDLDKIDWQYLSGNNQPPLIGLGSATLTFHVPAEAGIYEFRLYPNNKWTPILARSPAITVGPPP